MTVGTWNCASQNTLDWIELNAFSEFYLANTYFFYVVRRILMRLLFYCAIAMLCSRIEVVEFTYWIHDVIYRTNVQTNKDGVQTERFSLVCKIIIQHFPDVVALQFNRESCTVFMRACSLVCRAKMKGFQAWPGKVNVGLVIGH